MPDQEVHEIQLNGKQLVFMFMAATVVSVVIFLCGVMVGRGVRPPEADVLAAAVNPAVDPTAPLELTASRPAPTDPPPAPAQETLTYAEHLEAPVAPDEPLKVEPKPAVAPAVAAKAPAPPKSAVEKVAAAKSSTRETSTAFAEPPGNGWVVQVMAFPTRADAEALVRRLSAKGYSPFVTLNDAAPRGRYRVRIGKYPTKGEADAVSKKLRQEERFEPWVTH